MTMESQAFDVWGIVEIMGHLRLAGHLTEQALAGTAMLRVDVPESNGRPAFSRLFGGGAIYSVTPTTEEVARGVADTLKAAPLTQWDLPEAWKEKLRAALPAPVSDRTCRGCGCVIEDCECESDDDDLDDGDQQDDDDD